LVPEEEHGLSEEELSGLNALEEHSRRGGNDVWAEMSKRKKQEAGVSDNSDSQSWDDMKQELRKKWNESEGKNQTESDLQDLRKTARTRQLKPGKGNSYWQYVEERAGEVLSEGVEESNRQEELRDAPVNPEVKEAASRAFKDYAESGDTNNPEIWNDVSEELASDSHPEIIETRDTDFKNTFVDELSNGHVRVHSSHTEVKDELRMLAENEDTVYVRSEDSGVVSVELENESVIENYV
jgi:hypothetical protein